MSTEKIKILEMIEQGKISAKEGMELLNAIESDDGIKKVPKGENPKWIKIRVFDPKEEARVKVNLPLSLLSAGLKIGSKYSEEVRDHLDTINIEEVMEMIKNGAEGKVVDVEKDDGTKVEIFVE